MQMTVRDGSLIFCHPHLETRQGKGTFCNPANWTNGSRPWWSMSEDIPRKETAQVVGKWMNEGSLRAKNQTWIQWRLQMQSPPQEAGPGGQTESTEEYNQWSDERPRDPWYSFFNQSLKNTKKKDENQVVQGWTLVVEYQPCLHKTLGLIPGTAEEFETWQNFGLARRLGGESACSVSPILWVSWPESTAQGENWSWKSSYDLHTSCGTHKCQQLHTHTHSLAHTHMHNY